MKTRISRLFWVISAGYIVFRALWGVFRLGRANPHRQVVYARRHGPIWETEINFAREAGRRRGRLCDGAGRLMALNDVEHVEAVALINGILASAPLLPPEIRVGAEAWLGEHHPEPIAHMAAARSLAEGS